jgi:peptide/nickel transport system substrate-binding protein
LKVLSRREAIGRMAIVVGVIIIVIIGVGGGYYLSSTASKTTTSSTSSGNSSSSAPSTLVMDDANWPIDGANVLNFVSEVPWPDWFQMSVYQPLVTANLTAEYHSGTVQYLPVLANNWTSSNNNMTYTFNLKQGVTFSNGDQFNAYQVWAEVYGFYYLSGNSSGFWQSYTVFNTNNIDFGPSTLKLMNSTDNQLITPNAQLKSIMMNTSWPIYVTGPYQIVFQLKAPFLYFLGTLVSYVGMTFDTQYVLNHGGFGSPANFNPAFDTQPIPGTGPYTITGVSTNSYMDFSQNPTYWGDSLTAQQVAANPVLDPGHVKNVVINYVSDDLSRYTALSTGSAQIVAIDSSADWPSILQNPTKYSYTELPSWSADVSALALNTNEYPTNITAVRQAIVNAINYTEINDEAFYGQMTPGMGPEYPLYSQYYDLGNYSAYSLNVAKAESILSSAGINAKTLPPITFTVIAGCAYCTQIAQIVQSNLAAIGITVTISTQASSAYYTPYGSYSTNVADASMIGGISILGGSTWAPSALTPADNWVSFVSNASSWGNWAGFSTPTVQACVSALTSSSSVSSIQSTCSSAQQQIYTDAPYAWLGYSKLWYYAGSLAWQNGVIKSFYLDPDWNGIDTMPLINTVTFG